jgi:hypothetical protein
MSLAVLGHQSFQETRLLSKLAPTQRTHVQRLSTENKGGFPYIPFRAGYRSGGGGWNSLSQHNHMLFHWLF